MPTRLVLAALLLAACKPGVIEKKPTDGGGGTKDGGDGTMDFGNQPPGDLAMAPTDLDTAGSGPHGLPLVPDQGGPVIAAPHVVTVVFNEFTDDATLSAFSDWMVTSQWFTTVGQEYGVGAGTHQHVHLTNTAPSHADVSTTATLLETLISSSAIPAPTPSTIYMVVYTAATTLDDAPGPCASDYAPAYHTDSGDAQDIVYGVVATCPAAGEEQLELSVSHEVIEAATDPYPSTMPAYLFPNDSPWNYAGGELADVCDQPTMYMSGAATYTVPRVWSNVQARKQGDPCLPTRAEGFFDVTGTSTTATGSAGQTVTVPMTAWSTATVPDWYVQAAAVANDQAGDPVGAMVDKATANNGDMVTLTVTIPASAQSGEQLAVLVYSSSMADNLDYVAWPLVVTVQ